MILLRICLVSILVQFVLGGGVTPCGSLQSSFAILLQTADGLMDAFKALSFKYATNNPTLSNGFARALKCKVEQTQIFVSNATSQMSGISQSQILSYLHGDINPPFPFPLDCIEGDLLALKYKQKNITSVDSVSLAALYQPTPITPESPCVLFSSLANILLNNVYTIGEEQVEAFARYAPGISSIGVLDMYIDILDKYVICDSEGIGTGAADITGTDQAVGIAFATGTPTTLTHPMSCVESILNQTLTLDRTLYSVSGTRAREYASSGYSSSSSTSSSSICGTLGKINDIATVALADVSYIINYNLNAAQIHPELVPALVAQLLCRNDGFISLLAQSIELRTGISAQQITDVLINTSSPPFSEPLSCIANYLIGIRDTNLYIMNDLVSTLNSMTVAPQVISDTSCTGISNFLTGYNQTLTDVLEQDFMGIYSEVYSFIQMNITAPLPSSIQSYSNCKVFSTQVAYSTLLNANLADIQNMYNLNQTAVYPYSCVENNIRWVIDQLVANYLNFRNNIF